MSVGHPRGVQPSSLVNFSAAGDCRKQGLGQLSVLDDNLLLQVLELLTYADLGKLAAVSRVLYCFANHEELWKGLLFQETEAGFDYNHSWKETYLSQKLDGYKARGVPPLRIAGVFSDLLYQPWFLAHLEVDPEWLEADNIPRRSGISVEEFRREFEQPNRPVVLTGAAASWPAVHKWTDDYLRKAFGEHKVIAGEYEMTFPQYMSYARDNADEMPLYLFDKQFVDKSPQLADDFTVPEYFSEDLFSLLGDSRPDYRWLIIGPEKSGSTFHKDPNSTSAWNAVVRGSKKWILYPPSVTPPGVHASCSGADVVTSVSLMEWFVNFYHQARAGSTPPVEGVVRQSDVIFVPRGWWHMAINLEDTVAVTQNFVSSINLPYVMRFLRSGRADLVSGCRDAERASLYHRFRASLQSHSPGVLRAADELEAQHAQCTGGRRKLSGLFASSKSGAGSPGGSEAPKFAFNFGLG